MEQTPPGPSTTSPSSRAPPVTSGTVLLGDPFAAGTDLGPLISHVQRDRVAGFVERARAYARG